jgi:hypothetical protein
VSCKGSLPEFCLLNIMKRSSAFSRKKPNILPPYIILHTLAFHLLSIYSSYL